MAAFNSGSTVSCKTAHIPDSLVFSWDLRLNASRKHIRVTHKQIAPGRLGWTMDPMDLVDIWLPYARLNYPVIYLLPK